MSLLVPLGLLGLIGIIILIIIYIIKPNYQNKIISSTFVWKLSLKYRKKKIPINKLINIILFICQVAIIASTAFILAKPFIDSANGDDATDIILIVDASASMQTQTNQQTRLERAADAALTDAREAFEDGKRVSVILASAKAEFLVQEATAEQSQQVYDALNRIIDSPEELYTFGSPDIDGAMKMAEQITAIKEDTAVTLYTDTTYLIPGEVKVHNVSDSTEWNAAILDVRAYIVENLYRIEIDVASYGADARIGVECEIFNTDGFGTNLPIEMDVYCNNDETTTIVLGYVTDDMSEEEAERIDEQIFVTEFDQVYVHISEYDSLDYDNQFYLYGGRKPTLKVQYYSTAPNTYWRTALDVLSDVIRDKYILEVTEINGKTAGANVATEGYDLYIFEHAAPTVVPSDGIVIYSNVGKLPSTAGVRLEGQMQAGTELPLSDAEKHPIMDKIASERITVTMFTSISSYDGYTPLLRYEDYPMLLVKDDVDQKIVLMPFSVHYSNIVALPEFPVLLNNIANYFFPETIKSGYVYEPGDVVSLDSRAETLDVTGPDSDITLEELPAELTVTTPGIYTLTQVPISGEVLIENIYVKIPESESNICLTEDSLTNPYFFDEADEAIVNLLFYFALAAVALLFIEWWLKSREQI